jgi:hypothetical protein
MRTDIEILDVPAPRRSRRAGSCGEEGPLGWKVARAPVGLSSGKGPKGEGEKAPEGGADFKMGVLPLYKQCMSATLAMAS